MTKQTKGLLSIMVPVLVWGISFVSTEYLLDYLGPMSIGAVRFLIATSILYVMMKMTKQTLKIDKKDRLLFFLAGAIGITIYFYFENTGIKYISASPAALIIAAIPVFTLVFEVIVLGRKFKKSDLIAVILSVIGVVLIVDLSLDELLHFESVKGYLMMLGAVISWVIYSLASKPLFERYNYLTIIFYQFFYSVPLFLPFLLFEHNQWGALGPVGWGHLIFLSVLASVAGFYFYAIAMDLLGVTESSIFINFLPIVTIVFSYFYIGQLITPEQFWGGLLVILSVTITTYSDKRSQKKGQTPLEVQ